MEKCAKSIAYLMKEVTPSEGQKTPLRLNDETVALEALLETGCAAFKVDMSGDWQATVEKYSQVVGMKNRDVVNINPVTMVNYEQKLSIFFEEHLHTDPEVRFIIEGSGYFDIRDVHDRWVRIPVQRGDLLYLPAGIYHRFTTDEKDSIVAMRFFADTPRWEAHNRGDDNTESILQRQSYLQSLLRYCE